MMLKMYPIAAIIAGFLMGDEVEPRREFIFNNIDFSTIRE